MPRKYSQFITHNKEGNRHSFNDNPADIRSGGTKIWFKDGWIHRNNDKPAVTYKIGIKLWYFEGSFLRKSYD